MNNLLVDTQRIILNCEANIIKNKARMRIPETSVMEHWKASLDIRADRFTISECKRMIK